MQLLIGAPLLSADGTTVAFTSYASNLVSGISDTNGTTDVYVRRINFADEANSRTLLASQASGANKAANNHTYNPTLGADGTVVAFHSAASDLHPDDTDAETDVFAQRLASPGVLLVSERVPRY